MDSIFFDILYFLFYQVRASEDLGGGGCLLMTPLIEIRGKSTIAFSGAQQLAAAIFRNYSSAAWQASYQRSFGVTRNRSLLCREMLSRYVSAALNLSRSI